MCATLDEDPHRFCVSECDREYERGVAFLIAAV